VDCALLRLVRRAVYLIFWNFVTADEPRHTSIRANFAPDRLP
jgi:hypothetical protein